MNSSGSKARSARFNSKVFKIALDLDLKPTLEGLRVRYAKPGEISPSDRLLLRLIIEESARTQQSEASGPVVHDGESPVGSQHTAVVHNAIAATPNQEAQSPAQQGPGPNIPVLGEATQLPDPENPKVFKGGKTWVAGDQVLVAFERVDARREVLRDHLSFKFNKGPDIWWLDIKSRTEAVRFITGIHQYMEDYVSLPDGKARENLLLETRAYLLGQAHSHA